MIFKVIKRCSKFNCNTNCHSLYCRINKHSMKLFVIRHIGRRMMSSKSIVKEIQIPVPWGHIAGKEWGNSDGEPWIALHGWLDNCGSFDTLLPYFPKTQRIIAIDLPGHGFSSHFPPGILYKRLSILFFLKWELNSVICSKS